MLCNGNFNNLTIELCETKDLLYLQKNKKIKTDEYYNKNIENSDYITLGYCDLEIKDLINKS